MATFGDQPAGHHDLALREQALVAYGDGQLWQRTRELWDVLREEIAEERHIQAQIQHHLDNMRRKDSLRGTETTAVSVRLGNYSASYFEGSAIRLYTCLLALLDAG